MLDAKGLNNLFHQVDTLWIQPEIDRRRKKGNLQNDFKIFRAQILLPQTQAPIVKFNDEIIWVARAKYTGQEAIKAGDPIYLDHIERIEGVQPPEIDGKRVAFLYLYWTGTSYTIVFDFTPNASPEHVSKESDKEWLLGKSISASLQAIVTEKAILSCNSIEEPLRKIGLWAAPALLPYPLSRIAFLLREGNQQKAAIELLCKHCNLDFLSSLFNKWWSVNVFESRRKLIEDTFFAHQQGKYGLSIHALLPQIEGIITDWIYSVCENSDVPWRQESKTIKFRDIIKTDLPSTYTYSKIVESAVEFILSGPVLSTFNNWFESVDHSFANRNVVGHGKYDDKLFSEDNSIKLFLLLDTVYHIISNRKA
jgi:hypothetical protein